MDDGPTVTVCSDKPSEPDADSCRGVASESGGGGLWAGGGGGGGSLLQLLLRWLLVQ